MAEEIERKFLVDKYNWAGVEKPQPVFIKQGYLHIDIQKSIRVRLYDKKAFFTIKGKRSGNSRIEYEYEIPINDAEEMIDLFCSKFIEKKRYKILHQKHIWEVDEFVNPNNGLILAEIELVSENQEFDLPDWISEEVTYKAEFYNHLILSEGDQDGK